MRILPLLLILNLMATQADGRTCSISKEFYVQQPQILSGMFKDPVQLALPGLEVELLSSSKVVQQLRTDHEGRYDFGTIAPGKYRIRIKHGNDDFCAPKIKCNKQSCNIGSVLPVNPKNEITIQLD